ncbi:uncharacterized protein AMSG_01238 [Thecamonas trahens ATCC 50062]|uniref:ubiquitinyl hydrolase 1 n=1 Tax=Thecamonas trahens ATCC 50062 TaxID=461836 RepID=A0A0L0DMM5_THETB|nr:hypothetical protein AMSG_01238 [Thecamonas trahens ATCC 50062]KNC53525.1 hypothetical protein AMSG_01238 [Thecamonas trahens ATCC 50062]|eukprot:XP_013761846.1 hypothetical protein AMSG_01238 [Thecamonas trahens ATCC 50062]
MPRTKVFSHIVPIKNRIFRLVCYPHGNTCENYVAVFLESVEDQSLPNDWMVSLDVKISVRHPVHRVQRGFSHTYVKDSGDWGFNKFLPREKLEKVLLNGTLILEAFLHEKPGELSAAIKSRERLGTRGGVVRDPVRSVRLPLPPQRFTVVTDHDLFAHVGPGLCNLPTAIQLQARKPIKTVQALIDMLVHDLGLEAPPVRIWEWCMGAHGTIRPMRQVTATMLDSRLRYGTKLDIYLEFGDVSEPATLPDTHAVLYLKFYDPEREEMRYCGHVVAKRTSSVAELEAKVRDVEGLPAHAQLKGWKELGPESLTSIESLSTMATAGLESGAVVVYQLADVPPTVARPSAVEYARFMASIMVTTFAPMESGEIGVQATLRFHMRTCIADAAACLGAHLGVAPECIVLFKADGGTRLASEMVLETVSGGKSIATLRYAISTTPVSPAAFHRSVRVEVMRLDASCEASLDVDVDSSSQVACVISEVRATLAARDMAPVGFDRELRLVELDVGRKIARVLHPSDPLALLSRQAKIIVEPVPEGEFYPAPPARPLVFVHAIAGSTTTFGMPFVVVIGDGERMSELAERIKLRFGLSDADFSGWTFFKVANGARVALRASERIAPHRWSKYAWIMVEHANEAGIEFDVHNELAPMHESAQSLAAVPMAIATDANSDSGSNTDHICVICLDKPHTVVLLPCRHKAMCTACAVEVSRCPMCRAPFTPSDTLDVFDA